MKQGLYGRRRGEITPKPVAVSAHSVDSFQGNQAGVIAVSLVRNNTLPPGERARVSSAKRRALMCCYRAPSACWCSSEVGNSLSINFEGSVSTTGNFHSGTGKKWSQPWRSWFQQRQSSEARRKNAVVAGFAVICLVPISRFRIGLRSRSRAAFLTTRADGAARNQGERDRSRANAGFVSGSSTNSDRSVGHSHPSRMGVFLQPRGWRLLAHFRRHKGNARYSDRRRRRSSRQSTRSLCLERLTGGLISK